MAPLFPDYHLIVAEVLDNNLAITAKALIRSSGMSRSRKSQQYRGNRKHPSRWTLQSIAFPWRSSPARTSGKHAAESSTDANSAPTSTSESIGVSEVIGVAPRQKALVASRKRQAALQCGRNAGGQPHSTCTTLHFFQRSIYCRPASPYTFM